MLKPTILNIYCDKINSVKGGVVSHFLIAFRRGCRQSSKKVTKVISAMYKESAMPQSLQFWLGIILDKSIINAKAF